MKIYFGKHEQPNGGVFYTFGEHEDYKKARSALRKRNKKHENLSGLISRQLNTEQFRDFCETVSGIELDNFL